MRASLVAAFLFLLTAPALALPEPPAAEAAGPPLVKATQNGVAFVSGGLGQTEQEELRQLQPGYDVRVVLTDPAGEYLDDLHVTVSDASAKQLVDTTTQGPILLAQLAPGHYRLKASLHGWTTEERTLIVPGRRGKPVSLYVALHKENVG